MVMFSTPYLRYTVGQNQPQGRSVPSQQELLLLNESVLSGIIIDRALTPRELGGQAVLTQANFIGRLAEEEGLRPYLAVLQKKVADYPKRAIKRLQTYVGSSVDSYEELNSLLPGDATNAVVQITNRLFAKSLLFEYLLGQTGVARIAPGADIPEELIRFITVFLAFLAPLFFILLVIETKRKL